MQPLGIVRQASIGLTLVNGAGAHGNNAVRVLTSQLLAYYQQSGFTRLTLTGKKVLDVKESTSQIDLLVRSASEAFVMA